MTKRLSRDQREKSIIDTSLKLFAEHGFEATSMRAIANTEDISESMLYRFFSNKYEILEKIMESEIKEIIKSFKNIFETINAMIPDLEVSLPIIGKMMMLQITENQNIIRFITRERGNLPHILNDLREKLNIKE
ncbi:MAG: helix-turn-helix domain-containing protein, partial [Asgard group archaeon]|nr:helix-turn-helix domain-containing protein [Asgard group archaeon]